MKTEFSLLAVAALLLANAPVHACGPPTAKTIDLKKRGHYKRQNYGKSSGIANPANIPLFVKNPISYEGDGWQSQFPQAFAIPTPKPEWVASLNNAIKAGLIPNIPQTSTASGSAQYPAGSNINTGDPSICGFGSGCFASDDVWRLGANQWAVTFDDGPTVGTDSILTFLHNASQSATHYSIGSNIITNPGLSLRTYYVNQDPVQVHTWSHHYSTSLTNEQLVGELGWTIQAIVDLTGAANNGAGPALRPLFWRPPYGDVDMRVRAVARQVFNLTTVLWDEDSRDWCLTDNGPASCAGETQQSVEQRIQGWATGDHSQGLVSLEHELTMASSKAFIDSYNVIKNAGWTLDSIEMFMGTSGYALASSGTNASTLTSSLSSTSIVTSMLSSSSSSMSLTSASVASSPSSLTVTPSDALVVGSSSTSSMQTTTTALAQSTTTAKATSGAVSYESGQSVKWALLAVLASCFAFL